MASKAQELLGIQNKINQVSRINDQLDSKRKQIIQMLGRSANQEQLESNLSSLGHVYGRKEHVIKIVEKGLKGTLEILLETEKEIGELQGFKQRLKTNLLGSIPILGRKYKGSQPLIPLLHMMYSLLKKQIFHIEGELGNLKETITLQKELISRLIIKTKKGKIANIYETKYYRELETVHEKEMEIIRGFGKESQAFTSKAAIMMNKIQNRLGNNDMYLRHKGLAKLQVKIQIAPIVTPGTALTAAIAPPLTPFVYVALNLVNYSPTIAILGIEAAIRLKGPLERAKEFTALKVRVAKSKLSVPNTIFNEPQVPGFNQSQVRPRFAT